MFGHQDEPQQQPSQWSEPPAADDGPTDGSTDNNYLDSPSAPSVSSTEATPLLEPKADDGLTALVSSPLNDDDTSQSPAATPIDTDELLDIKQEALQKLTPLVGQLEQSPEEQFRTTMMMIQAADNQNLIPKAYEAANRITDEKARAQALLDIVNEINYFTQH